MLPSPHVDPPAAGIAEEARSCPNRFTLDLPLPPAVSGSPRSHAMLRQDWKDRCDLASLAQLAGAPRIDGQFELSITLRQSNNGAQLQSPVNDLITYLRDRELICSAGPAHMRRLLLAWVSADEAPTGCCLKLQVLSNREPRD
jgi:hypothetical protein